MPYTPTDWVDGVTPVDAANMDKIEAELVALDTGKANASTAVVDGDAAGGVLAGTYPNPSFAADMATQAELDAVAAAKATTTATVMDGDAAGGALDGTYPNPGLAATVAGAGLSETSNVLAVVVDATTIEIATDTLRVKDGGITAAKVAADVATQAELDAHAAAADPHTGYQKESEKGVANGYASLDSGILVPLAQIPTITAAKVAADVATQAELDAHVNDTSAAHAASSIGFAPAGTVAATDVQAAIAEVAAEASGISPTIMDAKGDLIAASGADAPVRVPVGTNGQVLSAQSGMAAGVQWATPVVAAEEIAYAQATANVLVTSTSEAAQDTVLSIGGTMPGTPVWLEFYAPRTALTANTPNQALLISLWESTLNITRLGVIFGNGEPTGVLGMPFFGRLRFTPTASIRTYTIKAYNLVAGQNIIYGGTGSGGAGDHAPMHARIVRV